MNGGGLLHTTLTSSASAQGARVSLKSTDNFPLSSLEGSLSWCSGEKEGGDCRLRCLADDQRK